MDYSNTLVVGVLTHNRVRLLERTLQSFFIYFNSTTIKIKLIIYDNGSSDQVIEQIKEECKKYGGEFHSLGVECELPESHELRDKNISKGHQALAKLMYDCDADAYLILEDDWECTNKANFEGIITYLKNNNGIGQIRLRNFKYDGSLTGGSNINFITKEKIEWERETYEIDQYQIKIGTLHWVNNPSIISREALKTLLQGFDGEVYCMEMFHRIFPRNAQLFPGIFEHIGPWRKREDLRRKGYIGDSEKNDFS